MCKVSGKKKRTVSDSVWLSDFSFSPASSSFLSGVLCGYRGAAVHHLPQGSSVLQTLFLSGATCRYGKEKQTTWQRVMCVWGGGGQKKPPWCWVLWGGFLCKVICMFSFWAQTVEITLKDRLARRGVSDWICIATQTWPTINLIWSVSVSEFALVEIARCQKYLLSAALSLQ